MADPRDNVVPYAGEAAASVAPRAAPSNVEAEQALLGALLIDNDCWQHVPGALAAEDFYVPVHGRIFAACRALVARGQIANPMTLKAYFEADDALEDVGGAQYLARLAGAAVSLISTADYAGLISDLARRRRLLAIADSFAQRISDPDIDITAEALAEQMEGELFALAERAAPGHEPVSLADAGTEAVAAFDRAYRSDAHLAGLSCGLAALDGLVGGLAPANLVILAGRPSMGKTALATGIGWDAARRGEPVAFYSLEMSAPELAGRLIAEGVGIAASALKRGRFTQDDMHRLIAVQAGMTTPPFWIDDRPAPTTADLHARARRLKRKHGVELVIVDYLQLAQPANSRRNDNRVSDMTAVADGLKALAKDLDVPVIALSQLSRAVESRDDKRPHLADLRESGAIEQVADVVMFLYREEYYLAAAEPRRKDNESADGHAKRFADWQARCDDARGRAEVIVAKHRHGPTGKADLTFDAALTRFRDVPSSGVRPGMFDDLSAL